MKWQTGASRIVEALHQAGVRCVFGLPGTQTLELFEALRKSRLRTVVATNELSAAFMAGGWARATGDPGVLITISGPGFTWALTGIAEARLDSVPLVHIVGAPPKDDVQRSFRQQELPQEAIAAPLVKRIIDADSYDDPAVAVLEALVLARSGEPGPVLLQVTAAMLGKNLETPAIAASPSPKTDPVRLDAVCARIRSARRPIFVVGQGANKHAGRLCALVERLRVPVITTPSARGVLSESHPLNLGFNPLAGGVGEVNQLLASADLVAVIGCKLSHSDTSGFELALPSDRLVHLDGSAEVIDANYPASLGVVGDAGDLFTQLLDLPGEPSSWTDDELKEWRKRILEARSALAEPHIGGTSTGDAAGFFGALRRALPDASTLVLDSGSHQILARRHYSVRAVRGLMMPTDLQSMGFAIPTAIGVKLASPDGPVVAVVGDGGFAMTAMELLSAVRDRIPLTVIVFADGAFGQIRLQQLANYGAGHGVTLRNPDFGLLAVSIGARYDAVGDSDNIEDAVRLAVETGAVTVIEVCVRDTLPVHRVAAAARARGAARRLAGPRVTTFVGRFLRRR